LKWLLIHTVASFAHLSILGFAEVRVNDQQIAISPFYSLAVVLYLALTPIQEFVARCCLQAPLQAFLPGTVLQRRLLSILISNLSVRWSPHAHQRRVCPCGLYSWNFLGLDFRKNKFAVCCSHVSLLDRWRRDLSCSGSKNLSPR
jgi:hypothetical protein